MSYLPAEGASWNGVPVLRSGLVRMILTGVILGCFELVALLHGAGMAIMVLALGAYAMGLTRAEMLFVAKATPVLAYPILALLSVVWSDFPGVTFRLALQLTVTAVAGLIIYRTQPFRSLRAAIFGSSLIVCAIAAVVGRGQVPLVGVADSKNMMAFIASIPVLAGVSIVADARVALLGRAGASVGVLFAALLMILANSAGSTVGTALGCVVIIAAHVFIRAPHTVRLTAVVAFLLLVPVGVVAQSIIVSQANEFSTGVLGKDSSLSGRTYLWSRAAEYFAERPLGGRGYGAFWVQGSIDAEGLWSRYGVINRGGFNFHNQFVDAAVDLGVLGVATLAITVMVAFTALAAKLLRSRNPELPYFVGLLVALCVRLPVESLMLAQFNIITTMFFMALTATVYGRDAQAAPFALRRARAPLRRQKLDRGLVQQREVRKSRKPKALRQEKVVKPAVHGRRLRRGRRVLRQTRVPLDAPAPQGEGEPST